MSFVVLALEPDEGKRTRFKASAEEQAASLDLKYVTVIENGSFCAVVSEPWKGCLSWSADAGRAAFILGYAIDPQRKRLDDVRLAGIWQEGRLESLLQPDGYFCAVSWALNGRFVAGVDPLGLYPMFHTKLPSGTLLCASAPGFMKAHPDFRVAVDAQGMAGLLMFNGLFENRTLVKGVRHLAAGSLLVGDGDDVREIPVMKEREPLATVSYADAVEQVTDIWLKTIKAHAPVDGRKEDFLLSGGRDSRLVVSSLVKNGRNIRPVTLGVEGDYEVSSARMTCKKLRLKPHVIFGDPDPDDYLDNFNLISDVSSPYAGASVGTLKLRKAEESRLAPYIWQGMMIDDFLGGYASGFYQAVKTGGEGPEVFFGKITRWGCNPDELNRLMIPAGLGDVGNQFRERFLDAFTPEGWSVSRASFHKKMDTRCRYHLGMAMWRFSFTTWPVMPVSDQALIAAVSTLPIEYVTERRMEHSIMKKVNAAMMRIPNDNNQLGFEPLTAKWFWPKWRQRKYASAQPLRYHRLLDQHHPGWVAIREKAESCRSSLGDCMDMGVLRERWPLPPDPIPGHNPFAPLAAPRSMMAVACWLKTVV